MDESNQGLFNILRIVGPIMFFIVVFAVLFKFTELGPVISLVIAAVVAIVDYFILVWLMRRVAGSD